MKNKIITLAVAVLLFLMTRGVVIYYMEKEYCREALLYGTECYIVK